VTPFAKWVRDRVEKWVGKFYEGPEPPARLGEIATEFGNIFPNATRREWLAMAKNLANEAYRSGYVRGIEWAERDPDAVTPNVPPDVIADMVDPDWRWRPAVDLTRPDEVVPEERTEARKTVDMLATIVLPSRRW
jgi:hypothetical protein